MSDVNGTRIRIRRFQSGDGERIRQLNERAMATTPEYVPDAPDVDLQSIQSYYIDDDGEFLVGTLRETIVATGAYATPDGWKDEYLDLGPASAELTRMRVDPDWHGRGFGSTIYRELERRARSHGYRQFVLDTGVENEAARGFYEAHGFECEREVTVDFGVVSLELALYQKSIGEAV